MENEQIIQVAGTDPMISEDAEPLTHVVGNEYDLTWRSVWVHGQRQSVRLLETPHGIRIEVQNKL